MEFAKSQMSIESREKWRKLVVMSSVVPKQKTKANGILNESSLGRGSLEQDLC